MRAATPLSARLARTYATEQPPKKDDDKAGKPAPGTENLYNDKESPLEKDAGKQGGKDAEPELDEGFVKLTKEDEEAMTEMLNTLKKGLPSGQAKSIEQAFEQIKKQGVPKEVREIMDQSREGKPMTLANAAKLARIMAQVSKNKYQPEIKKQQTEFKSNDNKESSSSGGSGGDKGGKGKKEDGGFKTYEFKFDTNNFLLTAFLTYMTYRLLMPGDSSRDITWQEFRTTFMDKGLVEKLTVVNKDRVKVTLHREAVQRMYPESPAAKDNSFNYYFSIGSVEAFERKLEDAQDELGIPSKERIPVSYESVTSLTSLLINFAPTILILGGTLFLIRRMGGGAGGGANNPFGMGKSRAKKFNHDTDIKIKFKDVAGMDEAKQEIMEFVSFLKTPDQYSRLGAKIPRGAILSGPPGTGKTLLAKATAGESGVPFFSVSGSEFVEMFVGVGPSRVRDLFAMARKNTPCIIFIDEIDAIGKARGKAGGFGGGNDERESTLNQILTEMDGFNTSEQVVVLAGTNRPDVLDKALMRPGRFDRHIAIDRPTMDGRKQIFAVHLKNIVTHEDMEYLQGRLSALTPGFSGADIANCCNEAALIGKFLSFNRSFFNIC